MIILAIDGSLACTGYCIYDTEKKEFLEIGSIPTKPTRAKNSIYPRLNDINKKISLICLLYKIDKVFIEEPFIYQKRIDSGMKVLKAIGVILFSLGDVFIREISNKTIKKYITGNGNADKDLVKKNILEKFPHLSFKNTDESDAVGIMITGLKLWG